MLGRALFNYVNYAFAPGALYRTALLLSLFGEIYFINGPYGVCLT